MAATAIPKFSQDEAEEKQNHVSDLLRGLLGALGTADGESEAKIDGQLVMLDLQINSGRYLLVRLPSREPGVNSDLSPRELEVARMVAKGYPNKIIAAVLEISSWTVCTHLRRIFGKLNVTSRAAMVAKLTEGGLLAERLVSQAGANNSSDVRA